MPPQDGNSTNNRRSGESAQHTTTSQNGAAVQPGNYGQVGSAVPQGFDGTVPGGQPHVQPFPTWANGLQPPAGLDPRAGLQPPGGLDPRATVFQPHQNQQFPPRPVHFAYQSHQNGQAGPMPVVPRPVFPDFTDFTFVPRAQSFQVSEADLNI